METRLKLDKTSIRYLLQVLNDDVVGGPKKSLDRPNFCKFAWIWISMDISMRGTTIWPMDGLEKCILRRHRPASVSCHCDAKNV